MRKQSVIAVLGPTASGKTDLGVAIAQSVGGEIINCDSVQVYREINIATAKPTLEEQGGVPHHLLDFLPPDQPYTAADWARDAAAKIEEIEARGRIAIIVGGSGFYFRAFRQPFFESGATDHEFRERLMHIRQRRGPEHLHRMLGRFDPETAARLEPRDWSRVQRALEVRWQTGKPLSQVQRDRPAPHESAERLTIVGLDPPRDDLYNMIHWRTKGHFDAGLVDEVRDLLARGFSPDSTALGSHGYRRVVEYLSGERTLESAMKQTELDVRHYAKRQLTWLRREPGVEWFKSFGMDPWLEEKVIDRVNRYLRWEDDED